MLQGAGVEVQRRSIAKNCKADVRLPDTFLGISCGSLAPVADSLHVHSLWKTLLQPAMADRQTSSCRSRPHGYLRDIHVVKHFLHQAWMENKRWPLP